MPNRPQVHVNGSSATAEEAAAVIAAVEHFLRDTASPLAAPERQALNPWQRAALFEGVGREADAPTPWGDPHPWGR
jgi:hypothetical protein